MSCLPQGASQAPTGDRPIVWRVRQLTTRTVWGIGTTRTRRPLWALDDRVAIGESAAIVLYLFDRQGAGRRAEGRVGTVD